MNHMIRITPIRVIGPDNEQVGVIETHEALRMAQEAGLDLVEVVADARPPVCKIMDYGKYKYDLSKKQQKSRAAGKQQELKEIRLGRSIKIDPHDVKIRVDQARKFLMAGHKVQITQRFRGREMMHKQLGLERLDQICIDLSDISKVELAPRWVGRQTSIVLAPDRDKIEAIKRKMTKEEHERAERELEEAEQARLAALEADAAEDDDDDDDPDNDHAAGGDRREKPKSGKGTKRGKGPADDRASNPVDDEIADLLGEV
ncbi:MAG: translation initiation factor IF-3 [Phycisphaeraceae bacterium]|nr:MAG: translation initiation factor IF-3 [Phycisphaeraceae bacterium]